MLDFLLDGIGQKRVQKLCGKRILVVETSDLKKFELTRRFYEGIDYVEEAHIREFYDEGEGKVVFWKKLN